MGHIRKALPEVVVLRTAVMVGFPGEDASAFRRLEGFVREGHFEHVGVFAYSREARTATGALPGQVRSDVKHRRRERLEQVQEAVWLERSGRLIGREVDVLSEGRSDDGAWDWMGRFYGQAPEVDGVVYWTGPRPGPFVRVRIETVYGHDLAGVALT